MELREHIIKDHKLHKLYVDLLSDNDLIRIHEEVHKGKMP